MTDNPWSFCRADRLFDLVKSNAEDADGEIINRLLDEFFAGYSLERLRELLNSDNDAVVENATWILSELGAEARPLLNECNRLLSSARRGIRFDVLDPILNCAGKDDADLLARAMHLVSDANPAVRWKCYGSIRRLSADQLRWACPSEELGDLRPHVEWLLEQDPDPDIQKIEEKTSSRNQNCRAFGAIAAARGGAELLRVLEAVAKAGDGEISEFARDELELLSL